MRDVLDVAGMVQRQAIFGENHHVPAVNDPSHDAPLTRSYLVRTIKKRITKMHRVWMVGKDRLLGLSDAPAFRVFVLDRNDGRVLGGWHRQTLWMQYGRIHISAVGGH